MASAAPANGNTAKPAELDESSSQQQVVAPKPAPRPRRPNYAQIHARPLPVATYPLPAFVPHNPLSVLRIAYAILSQYWSSPPSPDEIVGYFDAQTRSVHVVDGKSVRALWEQGFFGKGSLSRSEPTWLAREKQRRGELRGAVLAEDYTQVRRNERREFKNERARKEREAIEEQLRLEGKLKDKSATPAQAANVAPHADPQDEAHLGDNAVPADARSHDSVGASEVDAARTGPSVPAQLQTVAAAMEDEAVEDEEHLQLTLEEAFFLVYGVGALTVRHRETNQPIDSLSLFTLCREHSFFPPRSLPSTSVDDPFLLRYVVYHHFRSRGWVVRPGAKFSADFMIYNRGPVFSHAEFAVQIIPSYADGRQQRTEMDWWWYHCINRVQSQVLKTLVLVYVEVPAADETAGVEGDIGALLKRFKVREFAMKRWVANRSRS